MVICLRSCFFMGLLFSFPVGSGVSGWILPELTNLPSNRILAILAVGYLGFWGKLLAFSSSSRKPVQGVPVISSATRGLSGRQW